MQKPPTQNPTPTLTVPDDACPNVDACPLFPLFSSEGTAGIYKVHYCHSDYSECARWKMSRSGKLPPATLLPDGSTLPVKRGS